ncbi:hypothetical protein PVAP13_3NG078806 [Panicum virgatum]|uniref:Uncharacterized protein n=1 Tax=Panicum virgatum TaxID=38727 RepID=A0A8T0U6F8_PANVG|nr:hypothetical protein PVAP13_3NG078806 [Panicum virgatum]
MASGTTVLSSANLCNGSHSAAPGLRRRSPSPPSPPRASLRSPAPQIHPAAAALQAARLHARSAAPPAALCGCGPGRVLSGAGPLWCRSSPPIGPAATAAGARQATARSQAGASVPDPSADRPTRRVPHADGH